MSTDDKEASRIIYLSRHGQTLNNALQEQTGKHWNRDWVGMPGIKDLTELGKEQARVLAQYVGLFLIQDFQRDDIALLTSTEQRSIDTAKAVLSHNSDSIGNFQTAYGLKEQLPVEFVNLGPDDPTRFTRWYESLKPKAVLARDFTTSLENEIQRSGCKMFIAPLHGVINQLFIEHIGLDPFHMDNCSILPLTYNNGKFSQAGEYRTNDQLRGLIKG
jgi:broad specificity phosphatase PhoE